MGQEPLRNRLLQVYRQGLFAIQVQDLVLARDSFSRLLDEASSQSHPYGMGLAHLGLGRVHFEAGQAFEASRRLELALTILEGDCRAEDLADAHLWLGRAIGIRSPKDAILHLERSASIFDIIDRPEQFEMCWMEIAEISGWLVSV